MGIAEVWQVVAGMALVTYVPRLLPMLMLTGKRMPEIVQRWLSFVPAALLGALLCASLLSRPGEPSVWGFDIHYSLAAIPATIVAFRWRNILLTVAVGIVSAMLVR